MSVYIPIPISSVETAQEETSLTYRLDPETRRIIGKVDGLDAVNQAIRKAVVTPRFRCLIYDNQYGSEVKQTIIAGDVTPEFIEAEIPRLVKEAVLQDTRVLDVYNFSITLSGDEAYISFNANTIFGESTIEVVV